MRIKHHGELRVRGDDRGAERADRTLLLEQRRRVQTPPRAGRPNPRTDLEVDVPVRVTRAGGLVRDGDRLQLLDRHDLLLPARADAGDRVLAEPGPDLRHRVSLSRVQRVRDLGVQGGGDRQGLGDVHDHLREAGRSAPVLARQSGLAHRLLRERVDPVHPLRVLVRGQPELPDHTSLAVDGGELCEDRPALHVVVVSPRAIRLQVAARVRAGAPEQDHAAFHRLPPAISCFRNYRR